MTEAALPKTRRGWSAKKIILTVLITGVVIVGGFFAVGLLTPVETLVAMAAEEKNESKGEMLDPGTRFDEAVAEGGVLILRHTLIDGWYDSLKAEMGEELKEVLGRALDREGALSLLKTGSLELACQERGLLGKPEARVQVEYRDQSGNMLYAGEARASTC